MWEMHLLVRYFDDKGKDIPNSIEELKKHQDFIENY